MSLHFGPINCKTHIFGPLWLFSSFINFLGLNSSFFMGCCELWWMYEYLMMNKSHV